MNSPEPLRSFDQDFKFYGVSLGARMTVVDCGQGALFVHSPIKPTEEIVADLKSRGRVRWVVAPNKWHHLYLKDFQNHFPEAEYFGAPGLQNKRADFNFTRMLDEQQNFPWNPKLAHIVVKGAPVYNEVVFFHAASKTLILTDLAIHILKSPSLWTRIALSLIGIYGKFGWSKIEKKLFIKDREALNRSVAEIMRWDFERIIMAHGEIVESRAKEQFAQVFR